MDQWEIDALREGLHEFFPVGERALLVTTPKPLSVEDGFQPPASYSSEMWEIRIPVVPTSGPEDL